MGGLKPYSRFMKFSWKMFGLLAVLTASGAAIRAADSIDSIPATPTFTKDVLPIFQKSRQDCHRPGQMAPFSLINLQKEKGARRTTGAQDRQ